MFERLMPLNLNLAMREKHFQWKHASLHQQPAEPIYNCESGRREDVIKFQL